MGANLLPCAYTRKGPQPTLSLTRIRLAIAAAMTLMVPTCLLAQKAKPALRSGIIIGTAVDVNGDPVPNARVELKSLDSSDPRVVTTPDSGALDFGDVPPGVPYEIIITAQDFADWTYAHHRARTGTVQNRDWSSALG